MLCVRLKGKIHYRYIIALYLYDYLECQTWTADFDFGSECVFPFVYRGETYNNCTMVDSETELEQLTPWCAVNIELGTDVTNDPSRRLECQDGCPGTR